MVNAPSEASLAESFLEVWGRRALTIPAYAILAVFFVTSLPPLLVIAAASDLLLRRPWVMVRSVLLFTLYFCCELIGVAVSFWLWVANIVWPGRGRERYIGWNYRLQWWWAGTLFRCAARIFNIRVEIEGEDQLGRGPVIVFIRHASVADTLLPAMFISRQHKIRLRYVLKRQLLWDPCLDIVGNRLPNCFVRRGSGESQSVQNLMEGLGSRDGILIYPEGTRFTTSKRERTLQRLAEKDPDGIYARAAALQNVLPPRLGGALALLDRNEAADVVFCAHSGLDGIVDLRDFLRGSAVGLVIRIKFWRVPFSAIPAGRAERIEWLFRQWERVDDWVGHQQEKTSIDRFERISP
jgi:1-acyl-sn-glycerol-3-phosphate acyltransferase